jgi:hypothetical protein
MLIVGPLTEAEIDELMTKVREIEQRDPSRDFRVVFDEIPGTANIAEALAKMDEMFPKLPGQTPIIGFSRFSPKKKN